MKANRLEESCLPLVNQEKQGWRRTLGRTKRNRPTTEAQASAKENPIHQIRSENMGCAKDLPSVRMMDKARKGLRRKPMSQTDSGPSCGRTTIIIRMDCEIQRGEKPQAPQIGRGKPENLCSYRKCMA